MNLAVGGGKPYGSFYWQWTSWKLEYIMQVCRSPYICLFFFLLFLSNDRGMNILLLVMAKSELGEYYHVVLIQYNHTYQFTVFFHCIHNYNDICFLW